MTTHIHKDGKIQDQTPNAPKKPTVALHNSAIEDEQLKEQKKIITQITPRKTWPKKDNSMTKKEDW